MSRDAEAMLEKIDALARRFQGLERAWFYGRVSQMLSERRAQFGAAGLDCGEVEEIAIRASRETEQQ